MDFTLTWEQRQLRETARDFLDKHYPPERVAELADSPAGWDSEVWPRLAELGWMSPDLDAVGQAIVAEACGYGLFPGPWWSTVGLAGDALRAEVETAAEVEAAVEVEAAAEAGGEVGADAEGEAGGEVEAGAGSGRRDPVRPTTLALGEAGAPPACRAEPAAGGFLVYGTAPRVPDATVAESVIVPAGTPDGVALLAVDLPAPGCTVRPLPTWDGTRRLADVELTGAPGRPLVPAAETGRVLALAHRRGLALLAAEAVGVAERALAFAVEHAKRRTQFGTPIGAFQAVAHPLADTYAGIELARSLALRAAWCLAEDDPDAGEAALVATVSARQAALRATEGAIQVLGGVGFAWEHPIHRWYKRARWQHAYAGTPRTHRAALAAMLLDRPA